MIKKKDSRNDSVKPKTKIIIADETSDYIEDEYKKICFPKNILKIKPLI